MLKICKTKIIIKPNSQWISFAHSMVLFDNLPIITIQFGSAIKVNHRFMTIFWDVTTS